MENYISLINLFIKESLKIIFLMDGVLLNNILVNLETEFMMVMVFISNFLILTLLAFTIKDISKMGSILALES